MPWWHQPDALLAWWNAQALEKGQKGGISVNVAFLFVATRTCILAICQANDGLLLADALSQDTAAPVIS